MKYTSGKLCALDVEPDAWSHGVVRALITQARADLLARGVPGVSLWLLVGNARGLRFCEHDG
jgi:hypothetical protein